MTLYRFKRKRRRRIVPKFIGTMVITSQAKLGDCSQSNVSVRVERFQQRFPIGHERDKAPSERTAFSVSSSWQWLWYGKVVVGRGRAGRERVEDGCGCEMVARRQPPIINHTMIHSIVPLANSSPRLISVLREKEDPGEKARAFSREITSAAGRELASSSRGGNLSLLEPTIQHPSPAQPQRPTHASTRASEHHPPSLSSFFGCFGL